MPYRREPPYPFHGWRSREGKSIPKCEHADDGVWPVEFQNPDWYTRAGTIANWDDPGRELAADAEFRRGDFLVRNLMGVDQESGSIAVTDFVRVVQTVPFHVRDAATAGEDLSLMLAPQREKPPAAGALLFNCNGRGSRMFQTPCHDISAARTAMPQTPVAGFFAAGEIGPVGGKNFIHGHTASFALFRQRKQ